MIDKSEQNKTEMKETVNNWRKFKMQRAGSQHKYQYILYIFKEIIKKALPQ